MRTWIAAFLALVMALSPAFTSVAEAGWKTRGAVYLGTRVAVRTYAKRSATASVQRQITRSAISSQRALAGAGKAATRTRPNQLGAVNPTKNMTNCVKCVQATDNMLAKRPGTVAEVTDKPLTVDKLLKVYQGQKFGPFGPLDDIRKTMAGLPNGSRGIVHGSRGSGVPGHVFNVIKQRSGVNMLDGQIGGAPDLASGFKEFRLLRTN